MTVCLGLLASFFLALISPSASNASSPCWQLVFNAIAHSAAQAHAPYVSYDERAVIDQDGSILQRSFAHITYRDDGYAYVSDDRWDHPFVTYQADPGPPILGPYGNRRQSWLALLNAHYDMPTIADAHSSMPPCVDSGNDTIDGVSYALLTFPDARRDQPALKTLWIDRTTYRVGRVQIAEWVDFRSHDGVFHQLADYILDMEEAGGYEVIRRLHWQLGIHVFDQVSVTSETYEFSDYQFANVAPKDAMFADAALSLRSDADGGPTWDRTRDLMLIKHAL